MKLKLLGGLVTVFILFAGAALAPAGSYAESAAQAVGLEVEAADASPNEWVISNAEAIECAARYGPFACNHARDAANWARDVTVWKFPNMSHHNNQADAFRHCAWMGALATRVGLSTAYWIGHLHEQHAPGPDQEFYMDVWNNYRGAQYGQIARDARLDDQWGYVLRVCESGARNGHLYGLNGIRGNY